MCTTRAVRQRRDRGVRTPTRASTRVRRLTARPSSRLEAEPRLADRRPAHREPRARVSDVLRSRANVDARRPPPPRGGGRGREVPRREGQLRRPHARVHQGHVRDGHRQLRHAPLRRHPRVRPHPAPSSRRDLSRHDASSSHHARASRETTRPASHPPTHPPHPLSRRSGSLVYPPTDHDACYPFPVRPWTQIRFAPFHDDAVFVSTLSFRASSPDPSLEYSLLRPRPARLPGADS